MPRFISRQTLFTVLFITTSFLSLADEALLSKEHVSADIEQAMEFITKTHPDISYSANLESLSKQVETVIDSLPDSMTSNQAWMAMATLNPLFRDAHVGIRRPDFTAVEGEQTVKLPFTIFVDQHNQLAVHESSHASFEPMDVIAAINGIPSKEILETLIPRMRGESEVLRRILLARYFYEYFVLAFGQTDRINISLVRNGKTKTVNINSNQSEWVSNSSSSPFTIVFEEGIAFLTISSFDLTYESEFASFLSDAFAEIDKRKINKLVIDLRKNGGGARQLSDRLMAYLTASKYSGISGVTARITNSNIHLVPGANIGDVLTLPFEQNVTPPENIENRFLGKTYAMIGPGTYSQAIVFATTLQDYNFATLIGTPTEGAANQTGQVTSKTLQNTGFQALTPLYVFFRPSGETNKRPLVPSIIVPDDKSDKLTRKRVINLINRNGIEAHNFPVQFDNKQVPVGEMRLYRKSNIDGTNPSNIAVYYSDIKSLESLKWRKDSEQATLVKAKLDTVSATVKEFRAYKISAGAIRETGILITDGSGEFHANFSGNEQSVILAPTAWHSFDFDFVSLMYAMPHVTDISSDLGFSIYDVELTEQPLQFQDFGSVRMKQMSTKQEEHGLIEFEVSGPGLSNNSGKLVFRASDFALVKASVNHPDEPGYNSFFLELVQENKFANSDWEAYKKRIFKN